MITLAELKNDEIEAINKYSNFLSQEPHSKKIIFAIKKIKAQEELHLRLLRKLK
jgi:hypothetical protein